MLSHDLGRDRGGVATALESISARTLIVGVDSDRLFPASLSALMAAHIPAAGRAHILTSLHGHDGFLIEFDQLAPIVSTFLAEIDEPANQHN